MKNIPNATYWLTSTIVSNDGFAVHNLDTGFEASVIAIKKEADLITDDLKKEEAFNQLHLAIRQARNFIEETDLIKKDYRLKLLDSFELILRRAFEFDRSSLRPLLKWNANKEILAEIFMQLKNLRTDEGGAYLENSIEDISVFLKQNFNVYSKTELSTIQGTLKRQTNKIVKSTGNVKLEID